MKNILKPACAFVLSVLMIFGSLPFSAPEIPFKSAFSVTANAETEGIFTYSVSSGKAIVTGCADNASGSVTVPSSLGGVPVTEIGGAAFYECTRITDVTLPAGITTIGDRAFSLCSALTSVTIPATLLSIGYEAFYDCFKLNNVILPEGLTDIGREAFSQCHALKNIHMPDSVTNIGSEAFFGTAWLNNQPDGMVYAGKVALIFKGTMPLNYEAFIKSGTTGIAASAFYGFTALKSVTIPDSVSRIGDNAFYGCLGLTQADIPGSVGVIGAKAFYGCSGLTAAVMAEGVYHIGAEAFGNCPALLTISVPDSSYIIGSGAFTGTAWYNAKPAGIVYAGKTAYKYKGTMPAGTVISLREDTVAIAGSAFLKCTGLKSVVHPESMRRVGESAFSGCSSLTDIRLPDGVREIGAGAFYNCTSLVRVSLPPGTVELSSFVFAGCSLLRSVALPASVRRIGSGSFSNCVSLQRIYIPNGVEAIGSEAFTNSGLKSVALPKSVRELGLYAFKNCAGLSDVSIGFGIERIGYQTFGGCPALRGISVPDSVGFIDTDAFTGCLNLTIYGKSGSYAESFAVENYRRFIAVHLFASGCVIDYRGKIIYGIEPSITRAAFETDCVVADTGTEIEYGTPGTVLGTGDTVKAVDKSTGEVFEEYAIVIYGDVNGDGNVNAVDADICTLVQNWMIEWSTDTEMYYKIAGDVNADGIINSVDADLILLHENWVISIIQTTGGAA